MSASRVIPWREAVDFARRTSMDKSSANRAEQENRNAAPETEPAFDQAAALSIMDGDQAFLRQLSAIFVEDSPSLVAEIRAAIEQQDARRLESAAHKLKGSSYPFCAATVTELAQTLESLGAAGQMMAAKVELPRFETAINRLLTALNALAIPADGMHSQIPNVDSGPERATPCTA
jgi:HPt (histidine-containing phosphotransfer) domain-containing protein